MGYFCVAANTRWAKEHPDLSYGFPSDFHLPLTDAYLDYLGTAVEEALRRTDMDGFMVDWLWNPKNEVRRHRTRANGSIATNACSRRSWASRFLPMAGLPSRTANSMNATRSSGVGGGSTIRPSESSPTA